MPSVSRIPWSRILVEGFVIVISILLAFAIDAWWDDQVEQKREREHLTSMRDEFAASLPGVDHVLTSVEQHAGNVEQFIELLKNADGQPVRIPGELLGSAATWRTSDVSTSTLDALMASGDLNLIRNPELRAALAGLPAFLLDVTEDEVVSMKFAESVMAEFLAREGLAEVAYAYREGVRGPNGPRSLVAPDSMRVEPSEELIGMLTVRRVHLWFSEAGLARVREQLERLIEQIDQEQEP